MHDENWKNYKGFFSSSVNEIMTAASDWTWEKKHLTSPVTSVEFVGSDLVLSGEKITMFIAWHGCAV